MAIHGCKSYFSFSLFSSLDEENDTTSSEEEEEDRKRPSEELLGQICSIENVEDSASWFLALVRPPHLQISD